MINQTEKLKAQLVIVTGLVMLYFVFKAIYLLYAAAVTGIVFIAFPVLGDIIVKGWFKLAEGLGWINSRILLSIVFYVFLFPMALIYKIFSKNLMNLKNSSPTLYETRNHKYSKKDLENTW